MVAIKRTILLGVRRRGKAGKHGYIGLRKKWKVLAQSPYSLQGNRRKSPRVEPWNQWDRSPDAEKNPGSRYRQSLGEHARLWAHSKYIHVKQEKHDRGFPNPSTIEHRLPSPHIYIYFYLFIY